MNNAIHSLSFIVYNQHRPGLSMPTPIVTVSEVSENSSTDNMKIDLTSATGELGRAVLNAILKDELVDAKTLVVCVSAISCLQAA